MPKGDPAGYLPNVKKSRKKGKAKGKNPFAKVMKK